MFGAAIRSWPASDVRWEAAGSEGNAAPKNVASIAAAMKLRRLNVFKNMESPLRALRFSECPRRVYASRLSHII